MDGAGAPDTKTFRDAGAAADRRGRFAAGLVGAATLVAIGWTGLLIPSLIRSIEATFGQDDAGIAIAYLASAIAYGAGAFGGGWLTERLGRRWILGGAALVHGLGIAGLGLAPTWALFVAATLFSGAAAGCLDGGANGLVLDVYRDRRGQAMNLLHASFSVGALAAPLAVGALVTAGVPWQTVAVLSGLAMIVLFGAYQLIRMPSGRRPMARSVATPSPADGSGAVAGSAVVAGSRPGAAPDAGERWLLAGPLLFLGVAIATYVASEVGVSNWLVRFLEAAPLTTATLALSLYWGGLTIGRLLSSMIADRFDHLRFAVVALLVVAAALAVAVVVPSLALSIAAFAIAGVASGPVFPMIVAIGGDRYPDRSASVGGALTGMAVIGATVYPPLMGLLSVTVGLSVAMLGTALLALVSAASLGLFGRVTRSASRSST
jgi:fucose permease